MKKYNLKKILADVMNDKIKDKDIFKELLTLLEGGRLNNNRKADIIHIFAEAGLQLGKTGKEILKDPIFNEAEKEIKKFLNHPYYWLRYEALSCFILHWHLKKYLNTAKDFLINEPSNEDTRHLAASCIGILTKNTYDLELIEFLLKFLNDPKEDLSVRISAYDSIWDIIGIPLFIYSKKDDRRTHLNRLPITKKIDWTWKAYSKLIDWNLIHFLENAVKKNKLDRKQLEELKKLHN